jgi:tetratricopeptide (TPR) repeat protein
LCKIGHIYEHKEEYGEALRWLKQALTEVESGSDSEYLVERLRIYLQISWMHDRRGELEEAYEWRMRCLAIGEGSDFYAEMGSIYDGLAPLVAVKGTREPTAEGALRYRDPEQS